MTFPTPFFRPKKGFLTIALLGSASGNVFNSTVGHKSIASLSSNRVAASVGGSSNFLMQTLDFNGSSWSEIGSEYVLSQTNPFRPSIDKISSTDIAFFRRNASAPNELSTLTFNGSTWSLKGSTLSGITSTGTDQPSISMMSSAVAITTSFSSGNDTRLFNWNGTTTWTAGATFNIAPTSDAFIKAISTTEFIIAQEKGSYYTEFQIYRDIAGTWTAVGTPLSGPSRVGNYSRPSVDLLSSNLWAVYDGDTNIFVIKRVGDNLLMASGLLVITPSNDPALCAIANDRIAVFNGNTIQAYSVT